MAQYYQVINQSDKSQEETHQYYPTEQQTVQYVLTHEDTQQTFQGQQIMVNNQLMVVDNSMPPVIVDVDPSQIAYQPEYVVQEGAHVIYNEEVDTGQAAVAADDLRPQPVVLNHMQGGAQKILLSLHQAAVAPPPPPPPRASNQELQTCSVQQPATIGHMTAQLRQQLQHQAPAQQNHQLTAQQVYRNATAANQQQQLAVNQRLNTTSLVHPNILNQQQQRVATAQGATAVIRLPVVTGGTAALRSLLPQHQQQHQIQVGGVRPPGSIAASVMGRGVVRAAAGMQQAAQPPPPPPPPPPPMQQQPQRLPTNMLQQRQNAPQQQLMRAQLQQQQLQQQQGGSVLNTAAPTPSIQSNGDNNKIVQLEDGTLVPMAAYKQMMYNQNQAAAAAKIAAANKPPPKRRPAKPRAPKKTQQNNTATSSDANPTNPQPPPGPNANAMYAGANQNNQQPHQSQIPNQSPIGGAGRNPCNSISSGMIQNANHQEVPDGVSALANFVPSAQIQTIIANTLKNDNYSDSIRMLVLLENGEQRLITFTMPKEQCTIQEILEQVNVPFKPETKIEMLEMNCSGLNYVVGVGDVKVNMGNQSQHPAESTVPPTAHPTLRPPTPPPPQPVVAGTTTTAAGATAAAATVPPVPQPSQTPPAPQSVPAQASSPPPPPEVPKLMPGRLAICNHCGYLSEDFNRCSRCKHKFPELIKSMAAADVFKNGGKPMAGASAAENAAILAAAVAKSAGATGVTTAGASSANQNKPASAKKKPLKQKVAEPEPVVLLSSDEDDEDEKMKLLYEQVHKNVSCNSMKKEPTSVEITEKAESLLTDTEVAPDEMVENLSTLLDCRTIRVGSFRYSPVDSFKITGQHIIFKAPTIDNADDIKTVEIDKRTIVKVLINFNRLLPVIFYYVTPNAARSVRDALHMRDEDTEPYFDPLGKEEAFKRITVLPESFTEEKRTIIKTIYSRPSVIMEELSSKEANDILVRTCPRDIKKTVEASACFTEIRQLLIYPPGKGGISINTEDYMCLAQDQFLNDVIIDFYLQHLVLNLPPEEQEKIHVFSTFFYIRLTTKPIKASRRSQPAELDSTLTAAQKRHARVKNWTKKVDLFDKDFVIVPINESCHWFLAIICYPGMIGCHTMDNKPIQGEKILNIVKKNPLLNTATLAGAVTITQIKKEKFDPKKIVCEDGSTSDKDEAEGDDSEFDSMDGEAETEDVPAHVPKERVPIKQPCILIFDSLAGASRCRVVATLRDYLTCEYKAKKEQERLFNKDTIKGACPKVPQQTNYTDCGLYLLQYVESFLINPIKDYHIPINGLKIWFEEMVVTRKREDISNLIRELMLKHGKDPEMLPEIMLPTLNGELFSHYEDEPEEEEEEEDEETGEMISKAKDNANGASKEANLSNKLSMDGEDCNSTTPDESAPDTDIAPPVRIVRKLWPPPSVSNNSSSQSPSVSSNSSCITDDCSPDVGATATTSTGTSGPVSTSSSLSSSSSLSPGSVTTDITATPPPATAADAAQSPASAAHAATASDVLREKPTTDRETMSYLKSKRIVRHKTTGATCGSEPKKFKASSPTSP